jgi:hypothetical protein
MTNFHHRRTEPRRPRGDGRPARRARRPARALAALGAGAGVPPSSTDLVRRAAPRHLGPRPIDGHDVRPPPAPTTRSRCRPGPRHPGGTSGSRQRRREAGVTVRNVRLEGPACSGMSYLPTRSPRRSTSSVQPGRASGERFDLRSTWASLGDQAGRPDPGAALAAGGPDRSGAWRSSRSRDPTVRGSLISAYGLFGLAGRRNHAGCSCWASRWRSSRATRLAGQPVAAGRSGNLAPGPRARPDGDVLALGDAAADPEPDGLGGRLVCWGDGAVAVRPSAYLTPGARATCRRRSSWSNQERYEAAGLRRRARPRVLDPYAPPASLAEAHAEAGAVRSGPRSPAPVGPGVAAGPRRLPAPGGCRRLDRRGRQPRRPAGPRARTSSQLPRVGRGPLLPQPSHGRRLPGLVEHHG